RRPGRADPARARPVPHRVPGHDAARTLRAAPAGQPVHRGRCGMSLTFLWYIPNTVEPGHRGDNAVDGYGSLDHAADLARPAEERGWSGALIGTGWGRPDTFTVAAAVAARTTTFQPLTAIRPGYWRPAHFASAAATLDHLIGGRLLVNIVSGQDNLAAYG